MAHAVTDSDKAWPALNIACPLCAAGPGQYCVGDQISHKSRIEAFISLTSIDKKIRPTFESIYMRMALALAERSTCARLHVGCVISSADFRQVLAVGYNGGASGLSNDCESVVPGQCGHLHAELNALINCVAPRSQDKILFCTDLPCVMCARAIVNLGGVKQVHYLREYRLREGEEVLGLAGIPIAQLLI